MAKTATCDLCQGAIAEKGYKVYPAVVENGELVGTIMTDTEALQHKPVGDPFDVCETCLKVEEKPKVVKRNADVG